MMSDKTEPTVLIFDADVVVRGAVAQYLRECGYEVIESSTDDEARQMLAQPQLNIDIVIVAPTDQFSAQHFAFAKWIREQHANVRVLLAASVEKTARLAADICERGPHLRKPYHPEALIDWIKRLRS